MIPSIKNNILFGHNEVCKIFLDAHNAGRMHHAWLACGPSSIGKATLVYKFAKFLLHFPSCPLKGLDIIDSHPIVKKIESLSHPDFMNIDAEYTKEEPKKTPLITVDEIRESINFLRLTALESKYKVVVVNGADKMNINASNAMLKILEEPPKNAVIFLISDSISNIAPTIRSRCLRLKFHHLPLKDFAYALQLNLSALQESEIAILYDHTSGNLKLSIALLEQNGLELLKELRELLDTPSIHMLLKFAEKLQIDQENWPILKHLMLHVWMEKIRKMPINHAGLADSISHIHTLNKGLYDADMMHLDKQHVLLSNFISLQNGTL